MKCTYKILVGSREHSDILEAIQAEMDKIGVHQDRLDNIKKVLGDKMSNVVLPTYYQQFIHKSRYARWFDDEQRRVKSGMKQCHGT